MSVKTTSTQSIEEIVNLNSLLCPFCNNSKVIKRGFRKTENRGLIQRYSCNTCKKRFVLDDGFYRMRNNPQKITQAIDLFYRGVSTRKVQEHLGVFYPHNASNVSIYKWIIRYSKRISEFTNKLNLKVGEEVQVDEIEYHRRKSHKARLGIDKNWFIDSVCPKTKFMVASEYGKTRNHNTIKKVVSRIKDRTGEQVKVITTDGWHAYKKVVKKVFGYDKHNRKYNVFHNKVIVSENDGKFNYPIERLHNNLRARTKTFRGFHGSISSANAILKGYEIYYNFITKHQAINCYPYELATDLVLEDKNKWLELIRLSRTNYK